MKLNFGVIDIPHSDAGTETTAQVAQELEDRYRIMDGFVEIHLQDIADDMGKSLAGALESIMMGAKPSIDPFGSATSSIEHRFRTFLQQEEIAQLGRRGVPTKAALAGVSHRFKGKKNWVKKGGKKTFGVRRPSFIDTGQYLNVFKAWVEE